MGRNPSLRLDVKKAPSLFRCPISLEVMQSPVSLCTGVTYDRCSIQRWLDSGNTTCPATMLPLPSTDLVPNLTLRRLINVWSSSLLLSPISTPSPRDHDELLLLLKSPSSEDPLPVLEKLERYFMDDDIDESVKNGVVDAGSSSLLVSVLNAENSKNNKSMIVTAVRVLSLILTAGFISKCNKEITVSSLLSEPDSSVSSVFAVLLDRSSSPESRTAAGRVLEAMLSAAASETKISVARKEEKLLHEIIRLVEEGGKDDDVDAGLSCLASLWLTSKLRPTIVQAGAVAALVRTLLLDPPPPAPAMERAMVMLEAAAGCTDGQVAVGERAEECVDAAVGSMMKVGKAGREAAVGVLWSVCYGAGGGGETEKRRAREAVVGSSGAMAKILVVMQGGCSPRVTRMAGDLLRLFRGYGKSRLAAGYDTRTTHIRPF